MKDELPNPVEATLLRLLLIRSQFVDLTRSSRLEPMTRPITSAFSGCIFMNMGMERGGYYCRSNLCNGYRYITPRLRQRVTEMRKGLGIYWEDTGERLGEKKSISYSEFIFCQIKFHFLPWNQPYNIVKVRVRKVFEIFCLADMHTAHIKVA